MCPIFKRKHGYNLTQTIGRIQKRFLLKNGKRKGFVNPPDERTVLFLAVLSAFGTVQLTPRLTHRPVDLVPSASVCHGPEPISP